MTKENLIEFGDMPSKERIIKVWCEGTYIGYIFHTTNELGWAYRPHINWLSPYTGIGMKSLMKIAEKLLELNHIK